jgi:hypothetical protein
MIRRFSDRSYSWSQVKAIFLRDPRFAITNEGISRFTICLEEPIQTKAEWITIPLVLTDQVVHQTKTVRTRCADLYSIGRRIWSYF